MVDFWIFTIGLENDIRSTFFQVTTIVAIAMIVIPVL